MNKHYIRTDSNGYIIKSFSDAFEQPTETDIFIEEGERHYNLDIWENGIPKLKYDNSVRECTQAEIDTYKASLPIPEPSLGLKNRADIDYIAIMTGVDL